jgi:hypothetical protein
VAAGAALAPVHEPMNRDDLRDRHLDRRVLRRIWPTIRVSRASR